MAAVFVPESPHSLSNMSTRRAPLSSNPNAANSPCRSAAAAASRQQKRSFATLQREEAYGYVPPSKKQMVEAGNLPIRTPTQQISTTETRVFTRKSTAQPTTFERKLEAARTKPAQQVTRAEAKDTDGNLESIRQWQKHYRRLFPKMVFYFESVSEDVRVKSVKQVTSLGAREEKFFSNSVTHVITTRSIPPEISHNAAPISTTVNVDSQNQVVQTINPMLLERPSETSGNDAHSSKLGKFTLDAATRKAGAFGQDMDARRQQGRSSDVLHRARELRIKIWSLEKLQRMISTMLQEPGSTVTHGHNTRSHAAHDSHSTNQANLSQLLRNERINGPSDRDPTVATKDLIIFKGPYIYIRDIDEKQKPIMVREYAKVSNKEDGDWPQFRSVSSGKCPFVPELEYRDEDVLRKQRHADRAKAEAPRTRSVAAREPVKAGEKGVLADTENGRNRGAAPIRQEAHFEKPQLVAKQPSTEPSSKGMISAFGPPAHKNTRLLRGEPVASGVQPSNITSAIHSQMISSTAIGPGPKAGTSREVHGLQRKVLEKNSAPQVTTTTVPLKDQSSSRLAKRRAQEKLGVIEEGSKAAETKETRTEDARSKQKKKRDAKAGYCENCMEKFDDFDEHILSRKHRRFAEKEENWKELDSLLCHLARPLKPEVDYIY